MQKPTVAIGIRFPWARRVAVASYCRSQAIAWETTVAEQRARNIHVPQGRCEAEFVKIRTERDKTLKVPKLLIPSIQINMRAGELPPPEDNGVSYIKIPLNRI